MIVSGCSVVAFGVCFWQNHQLLEADRQPGPRSCATAGPRDGHGPAGATQPGAAERRHVAVQLNAAAAAFAPQRPHSGLERDAEHGASPAQEGRKKRRRRPSWLLAGNPRDRCSVHHLSGQGSFIFALILAAALYRPTHRGLDVPDPRRLSRHRLQQGRFRSPSVVPFLSLVAWPSATLPVQRRLQLDFFQQLQQRPIQPSCSASQAPQVRGPRRCRQWGSCFRSP